MDTHDDLITLRVASPMDLDTLERFQQGVIDAERQFDPMLREADVQYYDIAQMLANPELHLLVAAHGERPIACALDFPKVLNRDPMKPSPAPISAPINPKIAFSTSTPWWA